MAKPEEKKSPKILKVQFLRPMTVFNMGDLASVGHTMGVNMKVCEQGQCVYMRPQDPRLNKQELRVPFSMCVITTEDE